MNNIFINRKLLKKYIEKIVYLLSQHFKCLIGYAVNAIFLLVPYIIYVIAYLLFRIYRAC
jgi:hypothetical protein